MAALIPHTRSGESALVYRLPSGLWKWRLRANGRSYSGVAATEPGVYWALARRLWWTRRCNRIRSRVPFWYLEPAPLEDDE